MFETDTAILMSGDDGKRPLPVWKNIIICVLVIICFGGLYFTLANLDFQKEFFVQDANVSRNMVHLPRKGNVTIIPRSDWERSPSRSKVPKTQPASHVVISHTDTRMCSDLLNCCKLIYEIQKDQMFTMGYDDIGYNFLIGNDRIYEGRGWHVQPHDFYNYENNSISIALIGRFNEQNPEESQLNNLKNLINYGVENNYITKNYTLMGHKQFRTTDSPGRVLYDVIKKWKHWSSIAT